MNADSSHTSSKNKDPLSALHNHLELSEENGWEITLNYLLSHLNSASFFFFFFFLEHSEKKKVCVFVRSRSPHTVPGSVFLLMNTSLFPF